MLRETRQARLAEAPLLAEAERWFAHCRMLRDFENTRLLASPTTEDLLAHRVISADLIADGEILAWEARQSRTDFSEVSFSIEDIEAETRLLRDGTRMFHEPMPQPRPIAFWRTPLASPQLESILAAMFEAEFCPPDQKRAREDARDRLLQTVAVPAGMPWGTIETGDSFEPLCRIPSTPPGKRTAQYPGQVPWPLISNPRNGWGENGLTPAQAQLAWKQAPKTCAPWSLSKDPLHIAQQLEILANTDQRHFKSGHGFKMECSRPESAGTGGWQPTRNSDAAGLERNKVRLHFQEEVLPILAVSASISSNANCKAAVRRETWRKRIEIRNLAAARGVGRTAAAHRPQSGR